MTYKFQNTLNYLRAFLTDQYENLPGIDEKTEAFAERHYVISVLKYVENMRTGKYKDLQKSCDAVRTEHMLRLQSCKQVFQKFEEQKITYAVIKGAQVDKRAYKDLGLRPSGDLDVLIRKSDFTAVKNIFEEEGFVCGKFTSDKTIKKFTRERLLFFNLYGHQAPTFAKIVEDSNHQKHYIEIDTNFSVTWQGDDNVFSNVEILLNETEDVTYHGIQYKALNPELFLLQLCLHNYRDMNSTHAIQQWDIGPRSLFDIYSLVYHQNNYIDIDAFVAWVKKLDYVEQVCYMFYHCNQIFGQLLFMETCLDLLGFQDDDSVNTFGLIKNEKIHWAVPFEELFERENIISLIEPLLTAQDKKNLETTEAFMVADDG